MKIYLGLVVLIVLATYICSSYAEASYTEEVYSQLFSQYQVQFRKQYADAAETAIRYLNFKANVNYIERRNAQNLPFRLGWTRFTDHSRDEFRQLYLAPRNPHFREPHPRITPDVNAGAKAAELPDMVDWRQVKGVVTDVKDQGQCGSCWAFSAIEALESAVAIKSHQPAPVLSEQQLVDCSGAFGNLGCNGGYVEEAWNYIIHNGGVDTEHCYPYVSGVSSGDNSGANSKCRYESSCVGAKMTAWANVTRLNNTALMEALVQQPVSVAIDADSDDFMNYQWGTFWPTDCSDSEEALDHAVVLVGYKWDAKSQDGVWYLRNSWSEDWGMDGYMELYMSPKVNACGVLDEPMVPIVD
jgi:C1A family cysteine protease